MKEITRIHLAQTPFNSEVAAKKALQAYLEAIEQALGADSDVLREIEARIVELLNERGITGEKVITVDDVTAIEQQLGAPSEFVDEAVSAEGRSTDAVKKRLLRDTDAGMLGGVCAGIARYAGINPLWVRLAALLLLLLSFGTILVVYAVLWLVIPVARTAAEKLQMRGEPVTLAALKAEAVEAQPSVPERRKPLIVVLRLVLAFGFISLAVGAFVAMAVAAGFSGSIVELLNALPSSQPQIIIALLSGAISGLLFVALMLLGAYAAATWKVSKQLAIIAGTITLLGIVTFSTFIVLGVNGSQQLHQDVERLKTTTTINQPQLQGVRQLTVATNSRGGIQPRYVATTDAPRIEVQYLKGYQQPKVDLTVDKATATLKVATTGGGLCPSSQGYPCLDYSEVTIYGPALERVKVTQGSSATYAAARQNVLATTTEADSSLILEGASTRLESSLAKGSRVDATNATIAQVAGQLDAATLKLATVDTLRLQAPTACGTDKSQLELVEAGEVRLNDRLVKMPTTAVPCLDITYAESSRFRDSQVY